MNKPLTVVLLNGGTIALRAAVDSRRGCIGAVVELWYPGEEGGNALADILLGRVAPSGRMPVQTPVCKLDVGSIERRVNPAL